jgi:hypothetical protein
MVQRLLLPMAWPPSGNFVQEGLAFGMPGAMMSQTIQPLPVQQKCENDTSFGLHFALGQIWYDLSAQLLVLDVHLNLDMLGDVGPFASSSCLRTWLCISRQLLCSLLALPGPWHNCARPHLSPPTFLPRRLLGTVCSLM